MRPSVRRTGRPMAALVAMLLLCGCQTQLYASLPEQEANEMLALLLNGELTATKIQAKDGTHTLMVDEKQFAAAVDLLRVRGYPRERFSTIDDVFKPSGLINSPMQEQARFLWALGQELSRTVSQIDGVLTARVQVVLPDNDLLQRDPTPSSASVFVRYDESSRVASLVSQVKMLVANSVQGLTYDKVSVVLVPVPHVETPVRPPAAASAAWLPPALIGLGVIAGLCGVLIVFRRRLAGLVARNRGVTVPEAAE